MFKDKANEVIDTTLHPDKRLKGDLKSINTRLTVSTGNAPKKPRKKKFKPKPSPDIQGIFQSNLHSSSVPSSPTNAPLTPLNKQDKVTQEGDPVVTQPRPRRAKKKRVGASKVKIQNKSTVK